ncbi:DUF72 domain-containing protein [Thermorudis peleae]|uniref:DUF72 domain-containing protein n=1 Tax=Thermorudis peleae TaxID=1382356 RepID=UPI0005715A8F|nr:DUF72 domain-containing protein [Thermorudis peleae]
MGELRIGTSAWHDHQGFYPPTLSSTERLRFYAQYFPVVEVNSTYYHLPSVHTVEGWVERTPPGFLFHVKPPRLLTHTPEHPGAPSPAFDPNVARAFREIVKPLQEARKLGALTFQFPPSFRNTPQHCEYLKRLREFFPDHLIAIEFRRRDWLDERHAERTLALLQALGYSFTMVDEPQVGIGSVPPVYAVTNPQLALIRFHGRNAEKWYHVGTSSTERFDWNYQPAELEEWRPRINRALADAHAVHVLFNTNAGNQGPRNAFLLMDVLGVPHPPPPWEHLSQPPLFSE